MTILAPIGCVVIGRNEAARLSAAVTSVLAYDGITVIYVDSGSTDDSVGIAAGLGVTTIELDPARPFTAARARNEGAAALLALNPAPALLMFLDGDCVLDRGFIGAAIAAMADEPCRAIVVGHLDESDPGNSAFKRLAALEWASEPGNISDFGNLGGIMLVRCTDFLAVGGFNPDIIAGEDSEFGVRMALAGRVITKIDAKMATHDVGITRFSQWWMRSVRAGHALAQRYVLHGHSPVRDCAREYRSTIVWGIALPVFILASLLPSYGLSLVLGGAYIVLAGRMFRYYRRRGGSPADAFLGAKFGLYSKFANGVGVIRYWINRARRQINIIDYK